MKSPIAVALVHYPIVDRRGDVVNTAVTNLDLHDIARTARTYGVDRFYVVTPVAEQKVLVARILGHWLDGHGAAYNRHRGEALSLVRIVASIDEAIDDWRDFAGESAMPVLTGASRTDGLSMDACCLLLEQVPLLLVFGTGWGLAPEFFDRGWTVLEPIRGRGVYNHLPVRAAAAIILDRLLGSSASNPT